MEETYHKLKRYKESLYTLLDIVILTPYEVGIHSEVTLMCDAYFEQFCIHYAELQYMITVPEEVKRGYSQKLYAGVVVSHWIPFTAMQDQEKQSVVTGIIVRHSLAYNSDNLPVVSDDNSDSAASSKTKGQNIVDVTTDPDNKLRESYPLWKMFNFKIKYVSNKGVPVQIKFNAHYGGHEIEFDTKEWVCVRSNDTQTPEFESRTFIVI